MEALNIRSRSRKLSPAADLVADSVDQLEARGTILGSASVTSVERQTLEAFNHVEFNQEKEGDL